MRMTPEHFRAPERRTAPTPGPVLVLAPHADDEVIGCGGTLALHADRGDAVVVLIAFDGAAANVDGGSSDDRFVKERILEAVEGGRHLAGEGRGIEYEFWGLEEGHVAEDEDLDRAARRIERLLNEVRPGTLYAPWYGDAHVDHHSLAQATARALELYAKPVEAWGYEVWSAHQPDMVLDISEAYPRKLHALACHQTQMQGGQLLHRVAGLSAWRSMMFGGKARHAEAFQRFVPAEAEFYRVLATPADGTEGSAA